MRQTIRTTLTAALFLALPAATAMLPSTVLAAGRINMTEQQAASFSRLALDCINREYPNSLGHYAEKPEHMKQEPHEMHPVFYGCLDWHSAVHGHWLLVRLLRTMPGSVNRTEIISRLSSNITADKMAGELEYFTEANRALYERPYGRAWYLQLVTELREWDNEQGNEWLRLLQPIEDLLVKQTKEWLPNLHYSTRSGTHNQSAFALGLFLDYARVAKDTEFENLLISRISHYYGADKNCPIDYEPSGEDFLSACLMEADLMRRTTSSESFSKWLTDFLPNIPTDGSPDWLDIGVVKSESDGKLVHLYGVNISRAWALENIAAALPARDKRKRSLLGAAKTHAENGLASITAEHYSGSHWLASFATYLMTQRGMQ
jgi:hypothetical protein